MKLNLGCGFAKLEGWVNVDLYGEPDQVVDLEVFPLPWDDNSIDEINMKHVLEHIGQETKVYLKFIQELYRICKKDARIHIEVPHYRHDIFIIDPTHVRVITPEGIMMFNQEQNRENIKNKWSATPLGVYLNVDFNVENISYKLDDKWIERLQKGLISDPQMTEIFSERNNICHEISFDMVVLK